MDELFVRRAYTHNGITVVVEIDFIKETISLVEKDGTPKKWMFQDRGVEYMNGWKAIFAAMDNATHHAATALQSHKDRKTKDFAVMLTHLQNPKLTKSAFHIENGEDSDG